MAARATILDGGNTALKIARFEAGELAWSVSVANADVAEDKITPLIEGAVIYSSTGTPFDFLTHLANAKKNIVLSSNTPIPIRLSYETPETLGLDRIANMCGARKFVPEGNVLTIDMGTCITYDLLSAENFFLGGGISPGLTMRLKSMNNFTARLPLAEIAKQPELLGTSTQSCLQSGAFWGFYTEICGVIELYKERWNDLSVVVTGGDSHYFENAYKSAIFATPNLTLIGLNEILQHNIG